MLEAESVLVKGVYLNHLMSSAWENFI